MSVADHMDAAQLVRDKKARKSRKEAARMRKEEAQRIIARYSIPNPSSPRDLRPVQLITDRAKRYRANRNPPPGPRVCGFCSAPRARDIDHIDGDEANGAPRNLMYLCRTCNARKANVQAAAGEGTRTRQYNPTRPPTFRQYVDAVLTLRGDQPGDPRHAAQVLQATDDSHRATYRDRIRQARNPKPHTPTFQEYAYAVAIHSGRTWIKGQGFTPGNHDEGGAIIHATPKHLREKYARQIASEKRRKR
jgi:5-methylcytosine-specific restriction endonuclease McrA